MPDTLIDKIKKDIEKTGFITELKIGELLHKSNWSVSHSESYEDLDSLKSREIDIVSTKSINDKETDLFLEFTLVIEVKKATKYPWVIFTTPHVYKGWAWRLLHSGWNFTTKKSSIFRGDIISDKQPLATKSRFGKAFYEAFKTQNTEENSKIFDAILTVCKAAYYKKSLTGEEIHKNDFQPKDPVELHFYLPLIVLEGNLIEAYLDDENITLNEENWLPLEYSISSNKFKHNEVTFFPSIVTTSGFEEYLKLVEEWVESSAKNLITELKKKRTI